MTYADEKYANQETVAVSSFFSHGGQITVNGWGQCSLLSAHPGVCLLAPHPLPLQISSMLISNAILPVLHSPFFFSKVHPPVTGFQLQLLLVSLLSEKSTSLEASYQNLLQQGGRLKLSGMTCGLDGAGGGDKCMANLWNIWIKGWGLWQGHTMWRHGKWEVLESTKAKCTIAWNHFNRIVKNCSILSVCVCFSHFLNHCYGPIFWTYSAE